ncbi:hypothetical protein CDHC01_1809 [Corynebacterium diphtheriae HC01]|nr:hypothetical protein CD241_1807 [Corynebacterium diphtheriae 241]AEX75053.1 hypothetical protein CDHC01_1809 [Corynebacterium diphtheriae HC01]AEX84009.1 hypothetical protein CDVA01_1742 [Corynebacterium diphtheriae VA01]
MSEDFSIYPNGTKPGALQYLSKKLSNLTHI